MEGPGGKAESREIKIREGETEWSVSELKMESVWQRLRLIERHTDTRREREKRDVVNTYFPSESEKSSARRHRAAFCLFLQPKHHPSS